VTTTRTYSWTLKPPEEQLDDFSRRARKVLAWACEGDTRISCQGVTGEAFGVVEISFAVTGRDLWATGQISQDLINTVTMRLKNPADIDFTRERPPVHGNRGYGYGRKRRINETYGAGERAFDPTRLVIPDDAARDAPPPPETEPPTSA
jgi:hypothetical protein